MKSSFKWIFIFLFLVNALLRLTGLSSSPPGFYSDERSSAVHSICLSQTGKDAMGTSFPIFSPYDGTIYTTHAGALTSAGWTVPASVWIRIFGTSIESFRALSAFFSILTIGLIYGFVVLFASPLTAALCALSYAWMPASFHLSRLAWDNALVPFFLMAGCCFFSRAQQRIRQFSRPVFFSFLILSALFFATACLLYPSQRFQVPGLILALFWLHSKDRPLRRYCWEGGVFTVIFLVSVAPLIEGSFQGYLFRRLEATGIEWDLSFPFVFLAHFLKHLGPGFLFMTGDSNLRHSSSFVGELGLMEVFALLLSVFLMLRSKKIREGWRSHSRLLFFCAVAVVLAIVPASLTREVPHALRSIGMFPFVSILSGIGWMEILRWMRDFPQKIQTVFTIILIVSLGLFEGYFLKTYFKDYPDKAALAFDQRVFNQARKLTSREDWESFVKQEPLERKRLSRSYYAMADGGFGCEEVRAWIFSK